MKGLIKGVIVAVFLIALIAGSVYGGYRLGKSGLLDKIIPGQEELPAEEESETEELLIMP